MASKNSLGVTSNFQKAGTIPAKAVSIQTSVLSLKPRKYATTGKL